MPEKIAPILTLADQLRRGIPPDLDKLTYLFTGAEKYKDFRLLVRQYLPEREKQIFREKTVEAQIAEFANRFEDRYFPLEYYLKEGGAEDYAQVTSGIPIIPIGVSWDTYSEFSQDSDRLGITLMTYLVTNPYGDEGERVAQADNLVHHIPAELLARVPEGSFDSEELKRCLNRSPYKGLAMWAYVLFQDTGNFFLDSDEQTFADGCHTPPLPDWDKATVKKLTKEWHQADRFMNTVYELAGEIEKRPAQMFAEILDYILKKGGKGSGKKEPQGCSRGIFPAPVGAAGRSEGPQEPT